MIAPMRIETGTRAFVTGASKGIGRALCEALAARGAVLGLAARGEAELQALAAELPGDGHVVLPCDVGDAESVRGALDAFVAQAGGLDLLVANAGALDYRPFADQPLEVTEGMTRVNWLGTLYTVHHGLPHLLDGANGHVVLVSSGAALRSFPWGAVYGATKAAQLRFGEALRHELSGSGVSLTVVCPGEIETSLHESQSGRTPDWSKQEDRKPASGMAEAIVKGVERDARRVSWPPEVGVLGVVNGVSTRAADALLRRLRGAAAAPRRD
jgi:short-subunit dehydrogenase